MNKTPDIAISHFWKGHVDMNCLEQARVPQLGAHGHPGTCQALQKVGGGFVI